MGSGISSPLQQNLDALHNQFMRHAGSDYDIGTATTLTYSHFINYISELNKICAKYKDKHNCILVFAVKKGTDSSIFWKATVRIACVKLNTETNRVESHRLLNIRQFLQIFRRISYECTEGAIGLPPVGGAATDGATASSASSPLPPTMAASQVFHECLRSPVDENNKKDSSVSTNLEECIICLERKPEVILPCCHAYCTPCIEQWWEYCQLPTEEVCLPRHIFESSSETEKSCPVCRECLDIGEDTWVLSEAPDQSDVSDEIRKALISYASSSSCSGYAGAPSSVGGDQVLS